MPIVTTKTERRIIRFCLFRLPAATLLLAIPTAILTLGIRSNDVAFGLVSFRDGFFALLHLVDKSGLGRSLGGLRGLLGAVSLGRALRGGQVSELQIHGSDRHGPVLPPVSFVLL